MANLNVCPICGRDDRMAKVTAVVASSTYVTEPGAVTLTPSLDGDGDLTWALRGGGSGVARTELARRLAFPNPGFGGMVGGWIVAAICLMVMLATAADRSALIRIAQTGELLPQSQIGQAETDLALYNFAGVVGLVASIVAVWCTGTYTVRRESGRATWNRLYYCFCDDVVFLPPPGTGQASSDEMGRLLGYP